MNIGITASFVIGGIFLITFLKFNNNVINQTHELLHRELNHEKMNTLLEIIEHDFYNIGFGIDTTVAILESTPTSIVFKSDLHDDDNFGVTNVRWFFNINDPVTDTENPNDFYLTRIGPSGFSSVNTSKFPVTHFKLMYYNTNDSLTSFRPDIRKIEVELIIESSDGYKINGDNKTYSSLVWKRKFSPTTLNIPANALITRSL